MPSYPSQKKLYRNQTTTVRTVKEVAGVLTGWYVYNPNAVVAFLQFFDVAAGTSVTLATTVPDLSFGVPTVAAANLLDGAGIPFANGIKFACTTTEDGLTANASGLTVNLFFQ